MLAGEAGASADQFNDASLNELGRLGVAVLDAPLVAGALGVGAPELAGADAVGVAVSIRPSALCRRALRKKREQKSKRAATNDAVSVISQRPFAELPLSVPL